MLAALVMCLLLLATPGSAEEGDIKTYNDMSFWGMADEQGRPHGPVALHHTSEDWFYFGSMTHGLLDGFGVYYQETDQAPAFHCGYWKDGKRTAYGVMYVASGARYEGEFLENQLQGQGSYTSEDGRYDVIWKNHDAIKILSHDPSAGLPEVLYNGDDDAVVIAEVLDNMPFGAVMVLRADGDLQITMYDEEGNRLRTLYWANLNTGPYEGFEEVKIPEPPKVPEG